MSVASETVGDALVTWVRLSGGSVDPARVRTLAHDAREPIGAERWPGLVTQAAHPDDPPCERPLLYEVRSVAEEISQGVTRAEIAAALARLEREAFETSLRGLRVGAVVVHGPPDASGGFEGFEGFDVVRHDR